MSIGASSNSCIECLFCCSGSSRVCVGRFSADPSALDLMFDPQTSGGLLIALPANEAGDCVQAMNDEGVHAVVVGECAGDDRCGRVDIF
mgnify:CR=1 FL=1